MHDTNPDLFKLFLQYLYSGQLETGQLTTEQLADMMSVSDRYEVLYITTLAVFITVCIVTVVLLRVVVVGEVSVALL